SRRVLSAADGWFRLRSTGHRTTGCEPRAERQPTGLGHWTQRAHAGTRICCAVLVDWPFRFLYPVAPGTLAPGGAREHAQHEPHQRILRRALPGLERCAGMARAYATAAQPDRFHYVQSCAAGHRPGECGIRGRGSVSGGAATDFTSADCTRRGRAGVLVAGIHIRLAVKREISVM